MAKEDKPPPEATNSADGWRGVIIGALFLLAFPPFVVLGCIFSLASTFCLFGTFSSVIALVGTALLALFIMAVIGFFDLKPVLDLLGALFTLVAGLIHERGLPFYFFSLLLFYSAFWGVLQTPSILGATRWGEKLLFAWVGAFVVGGMLVLVLFASQEIAVWVFGVPEMHVLADVNWHPDFPFFTVRCGSDLFRTDPYTR